MWNSIFEYVKKEHSEQHYFHEPNEHELTMPLTVVASGSSRWYGTDGFRRAHTGFWGVELVTMGSVVFVQDGLEYQLGPGGVFLLRPGCRNEYRCGPEGVLHKRYVQIRGAAADRLFECSGLARVDVVRLDPHRRWQAVALLKRIHAECAAWTEESATAVSVAAYSLLLVLAGALVRPAKANPLVEAAKAWVQQAVSKPATVRACAAHIGVTSTHLNRLMRAQCGLSTKQYLMAQKMTAAANLLRETNASVTAIAGQVGFEDPLYFSHAFRRFHGRSPRQYREWIRQATR